MDLENIYGISFFYYGLPAFPVECNCEFASDLLLRDMLGCLSQNIRYINDHYDYPQNNGRHYEYPKFQDFSYDIGCHIDFVPKVIDNFKKGKDVYAIFYTSYWNLNKQRIPYVSGYFRVSKCFKIHTGILGTQKEFLGFKADEVVLVARDDALTSPFPKRSPVDTNSLNGKYKEIFKNIIIEYKGIKNSPKNQYLKYQQKTMDLLKKLKNQTFRNDIFKNCQKCESICYFKRALDNYYLKIKKNYLDYMYAPETFLTEFINQLKDRGRMEDIPFVAL